MKRIGFGILLLSLISLGGCGSNDTTEQQTDSAKVDKLSKDTLATDTSAQKPAGSGDSSQTAFPSSRKSNTQ
jgi:hypothetical protein